MGAGVATDSNPLNRLVVAIFGHPTAALWISLGIFAWAALIIWHNYRKHHAPTTRALNARLEALSFVDEAPSIDDAQLQFAQRFPEISETMSSGGLQTRELRRAWGEFRETIPDETEVPLRVTSRAEDYFLHLSDDTRVLAWWANIFVAIGLTFTFLGIVAALTSTVDSLNAGRGASDMTPALIRLLTITSVKFWTSIAGVGASIILRIVDRRWHSATQRRLEEMSELLDFGTLYSPLQRIAAEQLKEAKEQTQALKTFSHDLALAIGDNLERQMQPMISVLGSIQASIDDFKSGSFNQIGRELGEALSRNAGAEMTQLATSLTDMTARLSNIHEQLETSGNAASAQISAAAQQFSSASEQINSMFGTLTERIESTGLKVSEAAEDASRATLQRFEEATAGIEGAFSKIRDEIESYGDRLTRGADAAAERNADVLSRAADALEQATGRAATDMGDAIDEAVTRASEASAKSLEAAFVSFGERFTQASSGLIDAIRDTAVRMESLATSIERSTGASEQHADSLTRVGEQTRQLASTLTSAATDLQGAAVPIRSATERIGVAMERTNEALTKQVEAAAANQELAESFAARLSETSQAATRAWADYRERFEDVDRALAASLDQIKNASEEHAVELNEQVGRIDGALSTAVDKLASALDPLNDLAEQIEDLLGRMKMAA
jgi:methyl-accepting chemotaxis protein